MIEDVFDYDKVLYWEFAKDKAKEGLELRVGGEGGAVGGTGGGNGDKCSWTTIKIKIKKELQNHIL